MSKFLSLILLATGLSAQSIASTALTKSYYEITSVEAHLGAEQDEAVLSYSNRENASSCDDGLSFRNQDGVIGLEETEKALDQIISIGKKVWEIVKNGEPVLQIDGQSHQASVLPKSNLCWLDYENWSLPKSRIISYNVKNGWGVNVIKLKLKIVYTYGGSYNGKGKFLTNIKVSPQDVSVAWGFNLNATTFFNDGYNLGSKENPIAALETNTRIQISTPLQKNTVEKTIVVTGNGQAEEI